MKANKIALKEDSSYYPKEEKVLLKIKEDIDRYLKNPALFRSNFDARKARPALLKVLQALKERYYVRVNLNWAQEFLQGPSQTIDLRYETKRERNKVFNHLTKEWKNTLGLFDPNSSGILDLKDSRQKYSICRDDIKSIQAFEA